MSRVTLDSNVFVYAALEPQTVKGQTAARIIERAAAIAKSLDSPPAW